MNALTVDLARQYPDVHEGHGAIVVPVGDVLLVNTGSSSSQVLAGSAGLFIVVGIVLLIACSNVANLLLARAAARQHEMAVRLAMGASRRTLVRQLLTESVLLGLFAGAVGVIIAYGGLHLLFGALPSSANFVTPRFNSAVFAFALFVSLATGFLFGTFPALQASRHPVAETLKLEARTTGRNRSKIALANILLVGQVAFSFLLLMTAALFLRSIEQAYDINPGFQTAHLAVFFTNPQQAGYGKEQIKAFAKEVRDCVASIPGVQSVSWASNLPLWARSVSGLRVEGHQTRSQADKIAAIVNTVDIDYFETAGVVLDRGREFTHLDQENSAPVAIVTRRWRMIIGRPAIPSGSVFRFRVRTICGTLWVSRKTPAIPTGERRLNAASMCRWNRTTVAR